MGRAKYEDWEPRHIEGLERVGLSFMLNLGAVSILGFVLIAILTASEWWLIGALICAVICLPIQGMLDH